MQGVKTKKELSLGDLVLAKVKGFPAWPAKISRPEDRQHAPDPIKYFVQFFGTLEIAFVAPADIQEFTNEVKNKLSAQCLGKTEKYFSQAVKEICEEFEEFQRKKACGGRGARCVSPVVGEASDVNQNNGIVPECKSETRESDDLVSGSEHCSHKQDEMECQDMKPYLSDDVNHSLFPTLSSPNRKKLSANHNDVVNDSLLSSPSHHSLKKEYPLDIEVKGRDPDGSWNELTNGHRTKLEMGSKKKSHGEILRTGGSVVPHDRRAEVTRRQFTFGGSTKLSSPDHPKARLDLNSQKREEGFVIGKKNSDGQENAKVEFELPKDSISWKKLKVHHDCEKLGIQTNVPSSPAKILKTTDTAKDANLIKAQINCKSNYRSPNVLVGELTNKEPNRFSSGKDEVCWPIRLPIINSHPNPSIDEDNLPRIKRHRRESETMLVSALISESRLQTSLTHKRDLVRPSQTQSPVVQLPIKQRSICIYDDDDDDDDELPKTLIHGGHTSKMSEIQRVPDLKRKSLMHGENYALNPRVLRKSGQVDNGLKEQVQSSGGMKKLLTPAAQQAMEKATRESSAANMSLSPKDLESEKLVPVDVIQDMISPKMPSKSVGGGRSSEELESKQSNKAPGRDFRKRTPPGDNKYAASSDRSCIMQGVKTKKELSLGDLVLAKVKGFPAWPAKISRPEDRQHAPDPIKYFVQFFGTLEIAFVAPADIQAFTNEAKNELLAQCQGKTVKYFAQAVKEICVEFEEFQLKKACGGRGAHCVSPVVDEATDVIQNNGIVAECKSETKGCDDLGSGSERCPHKQDEMECQEVKPYLSDDVNHSLFPTLSSLNTK